MVVNEILKHANNYNYNEVLGIKRFAPEDEIKSAYKKLAIKVHPDKNNAPDANAAFEIVTRAKAMLLLETRRDRKIKKVLIMVDKSLFYFFGGYFLEVFAAYAVISGTHSLINWYLRSRSNKNDKNVQNSSFN